MTEHLDAPLSLFGAIPDALVELEGALKSTLEEKRWPLLRLHGREHISVYVRRAIFERDGGRCMSCGTRLALDEAQLDHIIPWSAFGADSSDNLRLLCAPCNSERSNFRGPLDTWNAKRAPVSFCCADCAHLDRYGRELYDPFPVTEDMEVAFCANCGLISRTWPGEIW